MQPRTIALFEAIPDASETIAAHLADAFGSRVITAGHWHEAHSIVANAKKEHIDVILLDPNLLPHKNHVNRVKSLVHAIEQLQIVPPPVLIQLGFETLQRHGERVHIPMKAAAHGPAIELVIRRIRNR